MPTLRFLVFALVAVLTGLSGCEKPAQVRNVVFIISDDHAADVTGAYGNEIVRTPHIDALAAEGVLFDRAFANAPMCSASRQSLMTGKYPHAAGVTLLRTSFPEEQVTLAEHLGEHGFKTGQIGKAHYNNSLPHGFAYRVTRADHNAYVDELSASEIPDVPARPVWRPFRDDARIWLNADMLPGGQYDRHSIGTFYARKAADFIAANTSDPFFLVVGFHEPHSPFNFPVEYAGKYDPANMPLPQGSDEDDRWVPAIFRDLTEADRRGIIASYYTSVEYMDKNTGIVLDALAANNLMDETLVVYLGDHGYLLNDHLRFEKHMMWEPAIRSPFVMRAGNRFEPGRITDALSELVDLVPTVLDVLELPPMEGLQGESLLPVLAGDAETHKGYVFAEFLADNKAMVRTDTWKYIFTSGKRDLGQGYATGLPPSGLLHRLYNLEDDPDEQHDVAGRPENEVVLQAMQQLMLTHFKETHPNVAEFPAGLSVDEALTWFCEPPDIGANLDAM
ncbi:MAG: sulfatase [Bacteroidota bacterium]